MYDPGHVPPVGMYTLRRSEIASTTVPGPKESELWEVAAAGVSAQGHHPLAVYDRMMPKPLRDIHSKNIICPAREVIAFFVHEGKVLHGGQRYVEQEACAQLLHISSFHNYRSLRHVNMSAMQPLRNWIFSRVAAEQ